MIWSRRQFLSTVTTVPFAGGVGRDPAIHPEGVLLSECRIPGETRAEDVFPAHPNGIRLARDRFLLIYATRGFRGIDEDRSIIYQVRSGGFTGKLLNEGLFARTSDDWDALGDGRKCQRCHGAPTAFGVPKGALVGGRPVPHANLFAVKWYQYARGFSAPGRLSGVTQTPELLEKTLHVEWAQFRLNDAEDDIEVLQPPRTLRQLGYEDGAAFSSAAPRGAMNQSFVAPVPFNQDLTEWIDTHSYVWSGAPGESGSCLAPAKYRYNPQTGRYEWVETGPALFPPSFLAFEASVLRLADSWAVAARPGKAGLPVLWLRTEDPFDRRTKRAIYASCSATHPAASGPVTAYNCADGLIRVFSGDAAASPYKMERNPLYCWDVDPDKDFELSNRRVVIDLLAERIPIRREARPIADFAKLLPHAGGKRQVIAHRVRPGAINFPEKNSVVASASDKAAAGIYHATFVYSGEHPDAWTFA